MPSSVLNNTIIVLIGFAGHGQVHEMLKEISPELARQKSAEDAVLNPNHSNLKTIDVTRISPSESVAVILNEIRSISS